MLPLGYAEEMFFYQNSHVARVILYKAVFSIFISKANIKKKTTSHLALSEIATNNYC